MPGRLPVPADFPSSLQLTITPPPTCSPRPTNILILLHGLGDTLSPFTGLGKQLSLPETVCISLQGLAPLPFDIGGFHWGDDITFDQNSGGMDFDTGFEKAVKQIKRDVIEETLIEKCGYVPREIMLFGLGQGGMAAIATAAAMDRELGGVISIGGPRPSSVSIATKSSTPILVMGGSSQTLITKTALMDLRKSFANVEYHKWDKSGDGMPQSRDEMLPIMRFFARRLKSRQGVPEGSTEIGRESVTKFHGTG